MISANNNVTFSAPSLSDSEYAECFDTFKQMSTEWQSTKKWLLNDFLPKRRHWTSPLNILSIGSGTGDFDLQMMKFILKRWQIGSYVAVDPNTDHNRIFQTRFLDSDLPFQDFRIVSQTFPIQNFDMKFDLVHMTHCLYYIPDRLKAIQGALNILNNHGRVLIFHQTPLGINEIQRRFLKRAKGHENELFSSKEIYQLLESLPIAFEFDIIDGILDVSEFTVSDSLKRKQILNFFLECRADLLPLGFRKEVVDFIKSMAFLDKNRQVIFHPVGVFSISRTSNQLAV